MRNRFPAVALAIAIALTSSVKPGIAAQGALKDVRTFVTLHVNTIDEGETLAVLRGDDVLIPLAAFDQAGIKGIKGEQEDIRAQRYVSLKSLAPDVTFKLDVDALSLDVTVAVKYLGKNAYNLNRNRPPNIEYTHGSSAFLNYSIQTVTAGSTSGFFEGAVAHDQDSFHASVTAETNAAIQRGLIYYQMDNRDTEVRRVIGDLNADSGDLGGSMFIGGFGVAREFELDPYAVHFPLPTLSGVTTSPSVANVYVNGALVQRIELPPGEFNLSDLPIATGNANAQIVITDALGRSSTFSQNYYTSPNVLTPGDTDYQFAAGLLRQNAFAPGDSYGPAAVVSRYRWGDTNTLTLGGRFEATPHLVSFGPETDFLTKFGSFHVAVSGSDESGLSALAASLAYNYSAQKYGFGFAYLAQGPYYATISQTPQDDRSTTSFTAFASTQMGRTSVGLQYYRRKDRDNGVSSQFTLDNTFPIGRGFNFTLGLERGTSTSSSPTSGITGTLNFQVGRTNFSATSQIGTTEQENISVQEAPDAKYGLSYYATYSPAYTQSLNGSFLYRSQYGDAGLDYGFASGSSTSAALRLSGGLAFIGGGIYTGEPIFGSYALVEVPKTPNVAVYSENQYVGHTDRSGRLLVPDLLPNFGNVLRIDDKDVPMNADIQTVERLIAPPEQAGAVVQFKAQYVHALSGSVEVHAKGQVIVPAYGEIDVDKAGFHAESALTETGDFYFENIPSGTYKATVLYAGGQCQFDFVSPETDKMLLKVGKLKCVVP